MKIYRIAVILILHLSCYFGVSAQLVDFELGKTFPLSELETMEGQCYSIDELKSDLLVMNFWNIGCKGCIKELPFLNKIYDKFKSENITFWSVTMNKQNNIIDHLARHPIKWELKGDVDFMGIFDNETLNIKCMPTTIVINREKEILYAKCAPILDDDIGDKFIQMLRTGEQWQ